MTTDTAAPHAAVHRGRNSVFGRVIGLVRRIIGVPDYEVYRRHMAACHPGQALLTEREFEEERMVAKYSKPGQRCC